MTHESSRHSFQHLCPLLQSNHSVTQHSWSDKQALSRCAAAERQRQAAAVQAVYIGFRPKGLEESMVQRYTICRKREAVSRGTPADSLDFIPTFLHPKDKRKDKRLMRRWMRREKTFITELKPEPGFIFFFLLHKICGWFKFRRSLLPRFWVKGFFQNLSLCKQEPFI